MAHRQRSAAEDGDQQNPETRPSRTILERQSRARSGLEVFRAFLALGLTSFGGPAAHIAYFRRELVVRREWLDDATFAEILALTQLLPGPGSTQTAFLLGVSRAGLLGGIAAWLGFALPSAALMTLFAALIGKMHGVVAGRGIHGLQVAAVSVVCSAVVIMFRRLCPDWPRRFIAAAALLLLLAIATPAAQMLVIAGGAVAGVLCLRGGFESASAAFDLPVPRRAAFAAFALFAALFFLLAAAGLPALFALYRTGALVFGGGHVVLPLLEEAVVRPGWVDRGDFLAGYGAAQAVPGPLFSFGAFLGYASRVQPNGWPGAIAGFLAIFSPGLLLAYGVAPFWRFARKQPRARTALAGVSAAVVGLLCAALAAATQAVIHGVADAAIALAGVAALLLTRVSPIAVVLGIVLLVVLLP